MKDNSISSGAGRLAVACRTCIQHARNIGISPKKNQTMKMYITKLFRLPVRVASLGSELRHLRLGTQRRMLLNNLALSIVLGASPAFANLVQDGSFENILVLGYTNTDGCPCAGYGTGSMGVWTVSVNLSVVGVFQRGAYPGGNVTDGNYAFALGMGGYAHGNSLSQVLPTVAGLTYRLSFDWGSEYARGTSAFVSVGNLNENLYDPVRAEEDYTSTPNIVNSSSFLFVASGNDRLTFGEPDEPFDWYGLVLDNIIVEPVNPPQLAIIRSGPNLVLSWPTDATGFVLESATTLSNGGDWQNFPTAPTEINGQKVVTITPTGSRGFFRLRNP